MEHTVTDWHGHRQINFHVNGRDSLIVCPAHAAPGNPWVWRTEFFGAFDSADRALLDMGWHLAYHRVSDMYGCPLAVRWMHAFHETATNEFGLSQKPVLFGFSRGGLYAFNYALAHPDEVSALYLDAPVLDIRSWPGAKGASNASDPTLWQQCLTCYGLTEETVQQFDRNPVDQAPALAAKGIPILLVAGLDDRAVPYGENGALLRDRYRRAGGELSVIEKPGCDHHPHSLEDPAPIASWILEHVRS